MKVTKMGVKGS